MELTKDIKFDKELKQNESITINYSGSLFKNGSDEIHIVFGYDNDWKNTTYQKMDKSETCFTTSIKLLEYSDFNFCFKDSYDNWDNNNCSNYTLKIEEKNSSTSDLNALLDDILNEAKTPSEKDIIEDSISKIQKIADNLDNILNEIEIPSKKDIVEDSISKIQKIADTFDQLFKDIEIEQTYNFTNTEANSIESEFDKLFVYSEDSSKINFSDEYINEKAQYFDSLLDNIKFKNETTSNIVSAESLDLEKAFPEEFISNTITETTEKIETTESIKDTSSISENSTLALVTTSKHKNIFEFENLSPWYVLKKRIRLAFYKIIYVLPAFLFGEEDDSKN